MKWHVSDLLTYINANPMWFTIIFLEPESECGCHRHWAMGYGNSDEASISAQRVGTHFFLDHQFSVLQKEEKILVSALQNY